MITTIIPQTVEAKVAITFKNVKTNYDCTFNYTVVTVYLDDEEYGSSEHMITRRTLDFGGQFAYQDVMDCLDRILGENYNNRYKLISSPNKINWAIKHKESLEFKLYNNPIIK